MLPTGQVSCRPVFFLFWGGGGERLSPQNQLDNTSGGPSVVVLNASFALIVRIVRTSVHYRKPCGICHVQVILLDMTVTPD